MPFSEILDNVGPPRRILRINQAVPDWKPGETYEAKIRFTLLEMDIDGMTVDVVEINLDADTTNNKEEDRGGKVMQVVPSPS